MDQQSASFLAARVTAVHRELAVQRSELERLNVLLSDDARRDALTLVGKRYADNANTTVLPGYGRWDALVGYRHKDWDLRGALNNITDREYYSSATSAFQIQPGAPRSLVVTGTYSF